MKKLFLIFFLVTFVQSAYGFRAELSWTSTSADTEEGFIVEKAIIPNIWYEIGRTQTHVVTFVDVYAAPGDCYRIRSYNYVGKSLPSSKACIPDVL